MSRSVCERFFHGLGADKICRSFSLNNPSCITGTIKLSISSAATNKRPKAQWVIPRGSVFKQGAKERTTVVDSKFETLQGLVDSTTSVLCYNKNRCLKEGVGCILSRDPNRMGMDIRGKGNTHKYFGIEGSEVSFNVISQTNENESSSFSNQQHNSLDVLTKNGGYWEQGTFGSGQGYMGLYPEEWDYDYSRISTKLPKRGGRLAVKETQGQFRMETSSPNISSNFPNKRYSIDRPVCISVVTSASKIFSLETRPIQSGYRCNATSLGKQIPLCISTFLNYQQSFKQSKPRQSRKNATCGTHLAISNLASDSVIYVDRETNIFITV